MKLYNAGSFFDRARGARSGLRRHRRALAGLDRVIVESHPALVVRARESIDFSTRSTRQTAAPSRALEVAMGLETAHPEALDRLNKRFTLERFARCGRRARRPRRGAARVPADLAAVRPVRRAGRVAAALGRRGVRSAARPWCRSCRREPATARWRRWPRPDRSARRRLDDIERSLALALTHARGPRPRLRRSLGPRTLRAVAACRDARRDRLHAMNLDQRGPAGRRRARNPITPAVDDACLQSPASMPTSPSSDRDSAGRSPRLACCKRGQRVALVERGRHPRFAIGESSTPLANLLIEELADRYDLPRVRAFSKWGTWQRARPEVACGLKRGLHVLLSPAGRAVRGR